MYSNNQTVALSLDGLANWISTVSLVPYFTCVHYCLIALTLRSRPGSKEHARDHSFASCFVCIVSCFGGSIICNFLMNKPLLDVFYINTYNIPIIAFIWYTVNFSPFDIFYNIFSLKSVKAVLLVLKEVHRIRQVNDGVIKTFAMYPDATMNDIFCVAVLIGSIRGSGAKFLMRPLDSFIRGTIAADNEFLKLTFSTNHAIVSSIFIVLQRSGVLVVSLPHLLFYLAAFAALIQLAILLFSIRDPYSVMKDLAARVLLMNPGKVDVKVKKD